nr:uncharacterized protein LOC116155643 [Camelus dromedarius]
MTPHISSLLPQEEEAAFWPVSAPRKAPHPQVQPRSGGLQRERLGKGTGRKPLGFHSLGNPAPLLLARSVRGSPARRARPSAYVTGGHAGAPAPGTPKKQERRKERTADLPTQILVFALSYRTILLPSHSYFNPEGLGCRSAKVFLCLRVVVVCWGRLQNLTRCNRTITPPLPRPQLIDLPTCSDRLNSLLFSSLSVCLRRPLPSSRSYYLRTVLETPHTRAPVRELSRLPGENWGTQPAGPKMKQI